jgi:hypothetical protein
MCSPSGEPCELGDKYLDESVELFDKSFVFFEIV